MSLLRNRSLASETQAETELRESQERACWPEQQENNGDRILPLTADGSPVGSLLSLLEPVSSFVTEEEKLWSSPEQAL